MTINSYRYAVTIPSIWPGWVFRSGGAGTFDEAGATAMIASANQNFDPWPGEGWPIVTIITLYCDLGTEPAKHANGTLVNNPPVCQRI